MLQFRQATRQGQRLFNSARFALLLDYCMIRWDGMIALPLDEAWHMKPKLMKCAICKGGLESERKFYQVKKPPVCKSCQLIAGKEYMKNYRKHEKEYKLN